MASKFQVEIKKAKDKRYDYPYSLAVTHNGYQWQSIGLTWVELFDVQEKIREFLSENRHSKRDKHENRNEKRSSKWYS